MTPNLSALLAAAVLTLAALPAAHGQEFDLSGYQADDGALSLHYHGELVDPHAAGKALLLARQGGMDIAAPAAAWIAWLLPRQRPDGHFERYCRDAGTGWRPCAPAEAPAALLAQWLELLYTQAPAEGLPPAWQRSAQLAWRALYRLHDPGSGLYLPSPAAGRAGLTENVEIYAAFAELSQARLRLGETREAEAMRRHADMLRQDIAQDFPLSEAGRFPLGAATQAMQPGRDPEYIAQLQPLLYGMPVAGLDRRNAYVDWLERNAPRWLAFRGDASPGGSVALAALAMGDLPTARCWRARAERLRRGKRWNIVEEAAYQRVRRAEPWFGSPRCAFPARQPAWRRRETADAG
jgi:hypothetical protein